MTQWNHVGAWRLKYSNDYNLVRQLEHPACHLESLVPEDDGVTGEKLDKGNCSNCGCIIVLVSTKLFCLNFWWGNSYQKLAYLMNLACCTCSRERVEHAENVVLETFLTTCIDIIVRLNYYQKMARNSWTVWSLLFEQRSLNLLNLLAFETWDNSIILTGVGLRLLQSLEPQPFKKAWPVKDKQV